MTYTPTTRRLNVLAMVSWATFGGVLMRACLGTAARGDTLTPPPPADVELFRWLLGQIRGGHAGTVLVIAAVFVVVKALRSYGGERWPVLRSPAGGAITGAVVSLLGGLLSVLVAGQPLSWDLAVSVLVGWWGASGGQSTLKDIGSLDFTPKPASAVPVVGSPL